MSANAPPFRFAGAGAARERVPDVSSGERNNSSVKRRRREDFPTEDAPGKGDSEEEGMSVRERHASAKGVWADNDGGAGSESEPGIRLYCLLPDTLL